MRSLVASFFVLALAACAPQPAAIAIDGQDAVTVHKLDAIPLPKADVLDSAGAAINPAPAIKWSVDPADIAKVDEAGKTVVPLKDGEATVTATLGEIKKSFKVVVSLPDTLVIDGGDVARTVKIGETLTLAAKVTADGTEVKDQPFTFSSSDPNLATVGADGAVTGVAAGEVTIEAKSGELKASAKVTVAPADAPAVAEPAMD